MTIIYLITPPGSTSKYFLQFSKNKFILSNPVMAIFQGGVINHSTNKLFNEVWIKQFYKFQYQNITFFKNYKK